MTLVRLLILGLLLASSLIQAAQQPVPATAGKLDLLDVAEHAYDGGAALAVVVSAPLDPKVDHGAWLHLSRSDGKAVDGAWVLSDSRQILYFPHIEPRTEYRLTVYRGLKAANGAVLAQNTTRKIKTRNIAASITFAGNGSLVPAKLESGLAVISVNVAEVDIDFHRVNDDKLEGLFKLARWDGLKNFWNLDALRTLATPVYSGRFALNPAANKRREFRIPLDAIQTLRRPGLYVAVMRGAAMYDTELTDAIHFSVSDIGMHARFYGDRLDLHLNSIADGTPIAGVDLQLLDDSGRQLNSARSTPEGLASFTGMAGKAAEKARFIIARKDEYFTLLDISLPALDLSDFNIGQRPYRPTEMFLYGPRDLYRPGEEVVVSGLLRDQDGHATHAPPLKARMRRPDGEIAREFTWHPEEHGYYELHYNLPAGAQTGKWLLQVDLPGSPGVDHPLRVEEFLPERLKLSLDTQDPPPSFIPAQQVTVAVQGDYLYGAPAAGNRLETFVEVRHFREPLSQWQGFQFGDLKEEGLLQSFALDDVKLNADGQHLLTIPSKWQKTRSPLDIHLNCSLYESGGRPVTRTTSRLVWPEGQALVGIRPLFGKENPAENSDVAFEVILAHPDGSLVSNRHLQAQLISEDRQYFWEWSAGRGWHYAFSEREYALQGSQLLSADTPVKLSLPVTYGHYRLEVSDPHSGLKSSLRFHAGRDWYYWWKRAQVAKGQAARPDQVTLSLDKPSYRAGETAELTIVPPADGEALILLESDRPLWSQRLQVKKAGSTLRIPIDPQLSRHDLYISAVVFRPAEQAAGLSPHRAFGLTHLKLDRSARQLGVAIDAPQQTRPNQQQQIGVRLDGLRPGKPARVTLAAVDAGVLSITRFATPDPLQGFFGQRRYGIDSRDVYDRIIDASKGKLAKLRFGGGDDEEAESADQLHGEPPKSDVNILSLFSGSVPVDSDGKARVPLDLPDFNGRVRLMALAFDADNYGAAEQEMTVVAPVVTQLSTPRFLARGDEARLALDLHNLSGRDQQFRLQLSARGPVTILEPEAAHHLAPGEKRTLFFTARATGSSGKAQIDLHMDGLREVDDSPIPLAREWHLGVRPGWPATSRRQDLVLQPGARFSPDPQLLAGLLADTRKLRLSLSASPNLHLGEQLDKLLSYPYGCLEQTSSTTYPLLFATPATLQQLGLTSPFTEKQRQEQIAKGLERLFEMQKYNGGFGLWGQQDAEEHWLTAYVGDLLLDAAANGVDLPAERLQRTLKRLGNYLARGGLFAGQRYSNDPKHHAFAVKSYAGYVLARLNKAPLGSLRTLYDKFAADSRGPLPLIHLGIALRKMGDTRRGMQAINRGLAMTRKADAYYGDYGSPLRDTARMLTLLLEHDIATDKARPLAFTLAEQLRQRRHLSTQERNALFLAGRLLTATRQTPWQAELLSPAGNASIRRSGSWSKVFDGKASTDALSIQSGHGQPLYVSAMSRGYTEQPPLSSGDALFVQRSYYDRQGQPISPTVVDEGDILLVRIELSSKRHRPDLLLADLLPAGFELENPNLPDGIRLDELVIDGKKVADWHKQQPSLHQEYREDRFVAALSLEGQRKMQLFYVLRAVTPGRYSLPAPMLEDMYAPEVFAIGERPASHLTIRPKGR
jgi:uncharacterized protein YfaS (alpha-2-macroglobulin family)